MKPWGPLKPTITNPLGTAPTRAGRNQLAPVDATRSLAWGAIFFTLAKFTGTALVMLGNSAAQLVTWIPDHAYEWAFFMGAAGKLILAYYSNDASAPTSAGNTLTGNTPSDHHGGK